ncbi:hypothetical protein GGH92_007737, partial [Coemansia sp. RSA 2673]
MLLKVKVRTPRIPITFDIEGSAGKSISDGKAPAGKAPASATNVAAPANPATTSASAAAAGASTSKPSVGGASTSASTAAAGASTSASANATAAGAAASKPGAAVKTDIRVIEIKQAIEEKEGIPPAQQRLIFGGVQMADDNFAIADYKIESGS